jgi:deazaflavin-dependent oxidoreductase (nitroreductase family)
MSAPLFLRVISTVHRGVYRATGGRLGRRMGRAPVLLLTTTGSRSGRERTVPLLYIEDGGDWIVVASNGGRDEDPAWWRNLSANGKAAVQVAKTRTSVTASEVGAEERDEIWSRLVRMFPNYDEYRKKTQRTIPVVRLHRGDSAER